MTREVFALKGMPRSAKLVCEILESKGPLSCKELIKETRLPSITLRYVFSKLKSMQIIVEQISLKDARKRLFFLGKI